MSLHDRSDLGVGSALRQRRFPPRLEPAFRDDYFERTAPWTRRGCLFLVPVLVVTAIGQRAEFGELSQAVTWMPVAALLIFYLCLRGRWIRNYWAPATTFLVFLYALYYLESQTGNLPREPGALGGALREIRVFEWMLSAMIITLVGLSLTRLPFAWFAIGCTAIALLTALCSLAAGFKILGIAKISVFYWTLFGLPLGFVSFALERSARAEFLARHLLRQEQARSEALLLNVLPQPIAQRLKHEPAPIAEQIPRAGILFADLVGFTPLSATLEPRPLVQLLNEIFSAFDRLAGRYHVEKIKTVGDCYMAVSGVLGGSAGHLENLADMALAMAPALEEINARRQMALALRIGINVGPVVAGVIGQQKFIYDLWGDAVNVASRMESHGQPGRIQVTARVHEELQQTHRFSDGRELAIKGRGLVRTHELLGRHDDISYTGVTAPAGSSPGKLGTR